jgi:hypothetical protein
LSNAPDFLGICGNLPIDEKRPHSGCGCPGCDWQPTLDSAVFADCFMAGSRELLLAIAAI